MILNRDEFFERVNRIVDGRTDDDAIRFVEDMTETYDDLAAGAGGERIKQLETEMAELDEAWRERYKARFFNGKTSGMKSVKTAEVDENGDYRETVVIEDLFRDKKEQED